MIAECLSQQSEFGIVWMSDDGLKETGCAVEIEKVLERTEDGRMNLLTRGTRPFRVLERHSKLPYPAGIIEFLEDRDEQPDEKVADDAHAIYSELVRRAADREPDPAELAGMNAYAMAGTVDFGLDAKQGLLDLRSENARLRLVARLFRAALKRMDLIDNAQERARSNGKIRFN